MRLLIISFISAGLIFSSLFSAETDLPLPLVNTSLPTNELALLDRLIEATQHSLEAQKALRSQIKHYQEMQSAYLKNTDNNEHLLRLTQEAAKVLDSIKTNHLEHSFDPEFISELALFAKVAAKRGVPSPVIK